MNEFEQAATHARQGHSLLRELWHFLRQSRKWWLLPVLVLFLVFALLTLLASSAAAPFIYTMW